MANYSKMTGPEMLQACGDDAGKWAEAFCEIVISAGVPIDHGLMVGWFANAIEHSTDVRTGSGPVVLPDGSAFFTATVGRW